MGCGFDSYMVDMSKKPYKREVAGSIPTGLTMSEKSYLATAIPNKITKKQRQFKQFKKYTALRTNLINTLPQNDKKFMNAFIRKLMDSKKFDKDFRNWAFVNE